jgi:diguanylate cyclase (GGDEF)-like protein/PAS domain S-box-containing protein
MTPNPCHHHAVVEAVTRLDTADPPRWRGRVRWPGESRPVDILIFRVGSEFRALPARCPHEGYDLSRCPLLHGNTLVCPMHGQRVELDRLGFRVEIDPVRFVVPLSEIGALRNSSPAAEPCDVEVAETCRRLREENEALRQARLHQEKQILAITRSMDTMLRESEQQKARFKEVSARQQTLGRFIHRVMDALDDLLFVIDVKGRIRQINPAVERQLGSHAAGWIGAAVDDWLAPTEKQALADGLPPLPWPVHSVLLETIRLHGTYSGEHRLLNNDRERSASLYLLKGSLLHSEQGKLEGAVVTATDITELKDRETRLRLSAKVFESSREAIFITDSRGTILEVNAAFCAIMGYERSEIVGQHTRILQSGFHDAPFYERLWNRLSRRGFWKGEIWDRRKSGELCPLLISINAVPDDQGRPAHYVAIATDISRQKQAEQELERLAYYDGLTGLPNRALFRDRFEHEIRRAKRHGTLMAIFFIDLDNFKNVNDTLGHWAGDALLKVVATRIQDRLRATDTVARLGGDEFTVILPGLSHPGDAAESARKLIDTLSEPVSIKDHQVYVGASIGIAVFPDDGQDFTTLTKRADNAMYASKAQGRGTFQYFQAHMDEAARQRIRLEAELRQAIERQEFALYYQPKANCALSRITGAEALIRWRRPDGSLMEPGHFIRIAEETSLIVPFGYWILKTACLQAKTWAAMREGFRIAVNLSAKQLLADDFIESLGRLLAETGTRPEWIELEITESLVMHDIEKATERLARIQAYGIHVTMDDFGTGYSSLAYLQKLPIQTLKIDRSFIHAYVGDNTSSQAALIKTIISLGQILNLRVVAEGVENEEQLKLLIAHGCHEIQGHYLSPALPAEEFRRRWLESPLKCLQDGVVSPSAT